MTIFYDHQTFSEQAYGGISRYYSELITGVNTTTHDNAYLPLLVSNNIHLQEKGIHVKPYFKKTYIPKKLQTIYFLNEQYTIRQLRRKPYTIFHATYYNPYFLPYLKGRPFVITFLDMIHERFGNRFPIELAYDGTITKHKRILAERADRIIAISESTKRDIVELLGISPTKIDVIYLGNSLMPKPAASFVYADKTPYILFVGNRSMYKNFDGMLEAIHPLLKRNNIKLVCAGGGGFTKDEESFIHSLKVEDLVQYVPIDDRILPALYQHALAFIFPSLYEGFGIPVLEAFACGCPCIVSNTSSLPEVAGDAAVYIDPTLPDSIAHAVDLVVHDETLRASLTSKGYERLTSFSWQNTVAETIKLYHTIT